jgi:hypothetical protein
MGRRLPNHLRRPTMAPPAPHNPRTHTTPTQPFEAVRHRLHRRQIQPTNHLAPTPPSRRLDPRRTLPTGETQWTRPGKDIREGISATCGHEGTRHPHHLHQLHPLATRRLLLKVRLLRLPTPQRQPLSSSHPPPHTRNPNPRQLLYKPTHHPNRTSHSNTSKTASNSPTSSTGPNFGQTTDQTKNGSPNQSSPKAEPSPSTPQPKPANPPSSSPSSQQSPPEVASSDKPEPPPPTSSTSTTK